MTPLELHAALALPGTLPDAIQAKAGVEENTVGALEAAHLLEPFLARDCLARDAGLLLADDAWVAASAR